MGLIDEQIKDAMRKGQFANLPGQGKPLKLKDDSNVPSHMRMANKLMRDNDLVPEWMVEGQELDAARDHLIADICRAVQANHPARIQALREAAKKYNSKVLSYNLKVPQGVVHKRHLDFEQELNKTVWIEMGDSHRVAYLFQQFERRNSIGCAPIYDQILTLQANLIIEYYLFALDP